MLAYCQHPRNYQLGRKHSPPLSLDLLQLRGLTLYNRNYDTNHPEVLINSKHKRTLKNGDLTSKKIYFAV